MDQYDDRYNEMSFQVISNIFCDFPLECEGWTDGRTKPLIEVRWRTLRKKEKLPELRWKKKRFTSNKRTNERNLFFDVSLSFSSSAFVLLSFRYSSQYRSFFFISFFFFIPFHPLWPSLYVYLPCLSVSFSLSLSLCLTPLSFSVGDLPRWS